MTKPCRENFGERKDVANINGQIMGVVFCESGRDSLCMVLSPDPTLAFHNVADFVPCCGGYRLHRLPREVREHLSQLGKIASAESTGVEIRFVTASPNFRFIFEAFPSAVPRHAAMAHEVVIFRGDFFHSRHLIECGQKNAIQIYDVNDDLGKRFAQVQPDVLRKRFSPDVWRICFSRSEIVFHELETSLLSRRPPQPEELPALRCLAYGSSITNGSDATAQHLCYIQGAARLLGVDVCNLGLGGACLCEPEVCDYLVARRDWDFAFFELGVNMRGRLSVEEFEKRVRYLFARLRDDESPRPVFVTGIYLNREHVCLPGKGLDAVQEKQKAFGEILAVACADFGVTHIDPRKILTDFSGLTADLLHPSDFGYQEMAGNLAGILRPFLPSITP